VSQQVESELTCPSTLELTCNKELDKENTDSLAVDWFGPLQNDDDIKHIKESRVPKKYIEKHLVGTSSWA